MITIQEDVRQLLVDLFSRRGRLPVERFRTAYLSSLAMMVATGALSLLFSGELSFGIGFFGLFLAFFIVANVAAKRHRDTLPLSVMPINPFRIFPSNPFANDSGPSGFCAIGLVFMAFSLLAMLHSGYSKLTLQFCATSFFIGSAATLATRYLWVAPSQPGPNQYGPNPTEVTP
ncbi:hypothetical protein [Roseobacter sp.]|uniref:hypothetical protein n=1 Tax=Roseobacter sp. TaxID=1907202 RepID=UPI002966E90E|nr:hypothetical protein [Roseobacter sp.]MDW3183026.1 hypothetical protein [Roseobacter sp.]